MSRNPTGSTFHTQKEWGSKHRKREEHQTGVAAQAEADAIGEQLDAE